MTNIIKIAVSVGEPAGIGPEQIIALSLMLDNHDSRKATVTPVKEPGFCKIDLDSSRIALAPKGSPKDDNLQTACTNADKAILICFCDSNLLYQRARTLDIDIEIIHIKESDIATLRPAPKSCIYVIDNYSKDYNYQINYIPGILDPRTAKQTLKYLEQATLACITDQCQALLTAPIHKSHIHHYDANFSGHTEYLENICNKYYKKNYKSVMMLQNNKLKVALLTTHIPVIEIVNHVTIDKIIDIGKIINNELQKKFAIKSPKILITGLNPHAGESGKIGREEVDIITPAIEELKNQGINASGPYAADSLFSKNQNKNEIILAMYHDQGLTGFKARTFNNAANITLGLPIIRTSVDHGTALDLAGTGKASINSLKYALDTAIWLSQSKILENVQ